MINETREHILGSESGPSDKSRRGPWGHGRHSTQWGHGGHLHGGFRHHGGPGSERWRGPGGGHGGQHGGGHGRGHGDDWSSFFEGRGERWGGPFGGRWGGPGGPGGPGGGRDRLERGLLRYVILDMLRDGPKHGYEMIKQMEERTSGRYAPSPGTLYPTLQYLDDLGLVSSDQEEGRRVYQLTDAGRAELDERSTLIEQFWSRFKDRTPSGPGRHEVGFLLDSLADLVRTVRRGIHPAMQAGDVNTIRRVRMALERCQNEVREIIAGGTGTREASSGEMTSHNSDDTLV